MAILLLAGTESIVHHSLEAALKLVYVCLRLTKLYAVAAILQLISGATSLALSVLHVCNMESSRRGPDAYADLLEELGSHLPHLLNVRQDTCRHTDAGRLICYDIQRDAGKAVLISDTTTHDWKQQGGLETVVQDLATVENAP